MKTTEPSQALQRTTMLVTDRAPSQRSASLSFNVRHNMKPALAILLLAFAFTGCGPVHEVGKGVSQVDWLPPYASNVTFVRNNGLFWDQTYECKMSKADFETFAFKNSWSPVLKKDVVTEFRRILGLPALRVYRGNPVDYYPEALVYEKFKANNGGIQVIYDIARSTLFVSVSSN